MKLFLIHLLEEALCSDLVTSLATDNLLGMADLLEAGGGLLPCEVELVTDFLEIQRESCFQQVSALIILECQGRFVSIQLKKEARKNSKQDVGGDPLVLGGLAFNYQVAVGIAVV